MSAYSIGIGILAHNEQSEIADTLKSLFRQGIFSDPSINDVSRIIKVEIIVVPNGCTDNTAVVAKDELKQLVQDFEKLKIDGLTLDCQVHEIETAGKSNAWNIYVHELSSDNIDLFVMIDADIEFNETDTIKNSLKALLENQEAQIVVDLPLKSIYKKKNKTLLDRISLKVSQEHLNSRIAVAGSFYCTWAVTLRQVWMPVGLPTEDSFVKSMIVTDMFRKPVDNSKIIRAENASHFYEPETSIKGILRHELRGMIGAAINCYLTWDFLLFATDPKGPGAGIVLKNLIDKNPNWLRMFLQNTIRNKGYWVLPRGSIWGELDRLRGKRLVHDFKSFLTVFLRCGLNLLVGIVANYKLKKGEGIGFW